MIARTSLASIFLTFPFVCLLAVPAVAEPFIPRDDAEVLERLPIRPADDVRAAELRRLRAELSEHPGDVARAADLAWRYVEIGRAEADPRYYGYAQAALAPWWQMPQPPSGVLLLRATLRQNRHDFSGALDDLERLLRVEPRNVRAWLTRAVVLQVSGDVEAAVESCLPVRRSAPLLAAGCMASAGGLAGRAEPSYRLLSRTLDNAALVGSPSSVEHRQWALTTLAEIAERLGWHEAAEQHFQDALALDRRDVYLLGAWADFLLDRGRAEEVVALLAEERRADALLLRLALAEARVDSPDLEAHVAILRARFAEARRRGDGLHLGAEARFRLHLEGDAAAALALALDNWQHQREPIDARLVLEAALAAGDVEATRPVVELIERTGLEDVRLAALVEGLADLPGEAS